MIAACGVAALGLLALGVSCLVELRRLLRLIGAIDARLAAIERANAAAHVMVPRNGAGFVPGGIAGPVVPDALLRGGR